MTTSAPHPQRCHECFEDPTDLELHWRRSLGHSCDWCDLTNFGASVMLPSEDMLRFHKPSYSLSKRCALQEKCSLVPIQAKSDVAYDIGQNAYFETAAWFTWNSLLCLWWERFNQVSSLSRECPIVANPHQHPQLREIVSIPCPRSARNRWSKQPLAIWSNCSRVCQATLHSGKRSLQSSANCRATSTRACSESKAG